MRLTQAEARKLGIEFPKSETEPILLRGERVDYLKIELPYPPTQNHLHSVYKGRKLLSADGRTYQARVALACQEHGHLEGRLFCHIAVYPPDKRKRDLCNVEKGLLDSIQKCGTFEDDSQIDELRITRMPLCEGGKVIVTLWEMVEDGDIAPNLFSAIETPG